MMYLLFVLFAPALATAALASGFQWAMTPGALAKGREELERLEVDRDLQLEHRDQVGGKLDDASVRIQIPTMRMATDASVVLFIPWALAWLPTIWFVFPVLLHLLDGHQAPAQTLMIAYLAIWSIPLFLALMWLCAAIVVRRFAVRTSEITLEADLHGMPDINVERGTLTGDLLDVLAYGGSTERRLRPGTSLKQGTLHRTIPLNAVATLESELSALVQEAKSWRMPGRAVDRVGDRVCGSEDPFTRRQILERLRDAGAPQAHILGERLLREQGIDVDDAAAVASMLGKDDALTFAALARLCRMGTVAQVRQLRELDPRWESLAAEALRFIQANASPALAGGIALATDQAGGLSEAAQRPESLRRAIEPQGR